MSESPTGTRGRETLGKQCATCAETKSLVEYYAHVSGADGHRTSCKGCVRARQRTWNSSHRDVVKVRNAERYRAQRPERLATARQHRLDHLDEARARDRVRSKTSRRRQQDRESYDRRADKVRAVARLRYQKNSEAVKAYAREYRKTHRPQLRARERAHRAMKRGARAGMMSAADRLSRLFLYGMTCVYCGKTCRLDVPGGHPDRVTEDHLIPLSRGGLDCGSNVRLACKSCNSKKSAKTPAEFRAVL